MLDNIDNVIQITVLGICCVISFAHAMASGRKVWILLGFFYGSTFAGTLYWLIYQALYYNSDRFSSFIADLAWNTSFYFLILLLLLVKKGKITRHPPVIMILIPAFTVAMCAYYITFGSVLSNIITMVFMTLIMIISVDGIMLVNNGEAIRKEKKRLYQVSLLLCVIEYALWTVSCIWYEPVITNPYYFLDLMLSGCYILFIPAVRKAVGR